MKATGQDMASLVVVYSICIICQIPLSLSIPALSFETCKTTFSHSFVVIACVRGSEYFFCLITFMFNKQSHSVLFLVNTKSVLPEK